MSVTGTGDGAPVRVGVSLVDLGTGMWAVIGLLASLLERSRSGIAPRISTSLFETSLAWMTVPLAAYAASGDIRRPYGSGVAEIVPYQAFEAKDGWLMIAAGNDRLFGKLCAALGMAELSGRAEFLTNGDRVVNRDALIGVIAACVAKWQVENLARRLDEAGVPNAVLNEVDKVFAHEQTRALAMIATDAADGLSMTGIPLSFDRMRPRATGPTPGLGQHNADWSRTFGTGRAK
jgi:crotonobetainyl-CoA:carnitine CoA-transferase CaiB-like acyl-CoA transferase